jgi:hypothetical protein
MRELTRLRKHLILALIVLGCILIDAGFMLVLGSALQWLAEVTSPIVLAGLAAIVIVAMRVIWNIKVWAVSANALPRLRLGTVLPIPARSRIRCNR